MLSARERERYTRQIPVFGEEGQERLRAAEIFIAGAGGLGCPVALYLAVAGVGTITVADFDVIELTNLNRQILHTDRDLGRKKTLSVREKLEEINPDIRIRVVDATIDAGNILGLVGNAAGIVDALDNFAARYLLNDAAIRRKIPLFHGAVRGMYGQATTIIPGKTPCLSCIFPKVPRGEPSPVVGVTPGIIGMVQATEVLKYLVGSGNLLAGRLFVWDGLLAHAEEISIERNPSCPACGKPESPPKRRKKR